MSFRFNPQRGLIMVRAELIGASGSVNLRLALDTGAERGDDSLLDNNLTAHIEQRGV